MSQLVGNPRAPWSEAMFAQLADGEWHPVEPVLRAMERAIGPQQAASAYRRRVVKPRKGGAEHRVKAQDTREQVRDGRRMQARKTFLDWKKAGKIEVDPPDYRAPNKRVRLVPHG